MKNKWIVLLFAFLNLLAGHLVNADDCQDCTAPYAAVHLDLASGPGAAVLSVLTLSGTDVSGPDGNYMYNTCSSSVNVSVENDMENVMLCTVSYQVLKYDYSTSTLTTILSQSSTPATQSFSSCGLYMIKVVGFFAPLCNLDKIFTVVTVWVCVKGSTSIPTISGSTNICPAQIGSSYLTASDSTTYNLQWYKDGSPISGATYGRYAPTSSGVYKVKVNSYVNTSCGVTAGPYSNSDTVCVFPYDAFAFSGLKQYYCGEDNYTILAGTPVGGEFSGTGVSTVGGQTRFTPSAAGVGVHTITYDFDNTPTCGCPDRVTQNTLVLPKAPLIDRVITATATSYSDNWPMEAGDVSSLLSDTKRNALTVATPFDNGSKGIWKADESFVHVKNRTQDSTIKLSADGIFNHMPLFMFDNGAMGACYPNWRNMNTVTQYNPNSYETENKDILGRYSSALYGYKGDLPVAVATNAAEYEIGFAGFEEFSADSALTIQNTASGNLTLLTQTPTTSGKQNQSFKTYVVELATDGALTIAIPSTDLSFLAGKSVHAYGALMDVYNVKNIIGIYTVASVAPHSTQAGKSVVTLSGFDFSGVWRGKISYSTDFIATPTIPSGTTITATKAHTGKNSFYIPSDYKSEQPKIILAPGKSYMLSGWVHTDNPSDSISFKSPSGTARGLKLEFYNSLTATSPFSSSAIAEPSGDVIEGWQRIEMDVLIPANTVKVGLVLSAGSYATYFDDIRIFPMLGNMKSYVYNLSNYRLAAELDNNNYATLYHYDEQGNLFLIEKETERGIMSIQESMSHQGE